MLAILNSYVEALIPLGFHCDEANALEQEK